MIRASSRHLFHLISSTAVHYRTVQLIVRLNKPIIAWKWNIPGRILDLSFSCVHYSLQLARTCYIDVQRFFVNEDRSKNGLVLAISGPEVTGTRWYNDFNGYNFANVELRFLFRAISYPIILFQLQGRYKFYNFHVNAANGVPRSCVGAGVVSIYRGSFEQLHRGDEYSG